MPLRIKNNLKSNVHKIVYISSFIHYTFQKSKVDILHGSLQYLQIPNSAEPEAMGSPIAVTAVY